VASEHGHGRSAQAIILGKSGSRSLDEINTNFFYTNKSGLRLADVQAHFMSLFPSTKKQRVNPQILRGYKDNEVKTSIDRGIYMRKINLRAIPWGRAPKQIDAKTRRLIQGEVWRKSYDALPPMMAFDVDENSAHDFRKLYPDHHCHEIHDHFDIPRPLVTTINPVTKNCQFIYEIAWTRDDYTNSATAYAEYEKIRQEMSPN
jgi:hypothetical protein